MASLCGRKIASLTCDLIGRLARTNKSPLPPQTRSADQETENVERRRQPILTMLHGGAIRYFKRLKYALLWSLTRYTEN